MSLRLFALAVLSLAATGATAQTGAHTFQIVDGEVYLDGRPLPDAVPDGLDLDGLDSELLRFQEPTRPIIEVDGEVYVLENDRLISLDQSSRPGRGVYMLYQGTDAVAGMPEAQAEPIVQEVYMRDIAARNEALYEQLRTEQRMDREAVMLSNRIRPLAAGPERVRLMEELRGRLSDLLSLKHQIRREEIALVQARLDALTAQLDEREDLHDEIVAERLRQLAGDE
ncbi:MAG: hypothetical protein AAF845_19720 [Bacteroidota bacterium]